MAKKTCEKCGKTMDDIQFYTYKSGDKTELCKKCLTMHIDNFDPNTFLWILEKMDVPYIPSEWNTLRDKAFAKDPNKINGTSVIGKYLSKMKLKQFNTKGWADSETLQAEAQEKLDEQERLRLENDEKWRAKRDSGEITEAEYKTLVSTESQAKSLVAAAPTQMTTPTPFHEENFIPEEDLIDLGADLTDDDKKYLAMKWGRLYQPREWVELEKSYNEMTESFDIQDADTINTLKLICKTNLKMNQAIDEADLEGFQKLSRVYESLRKSAKLTAAQNKEEKNDFVDCVGELVTMCEKEGFIPRFATDIPQDKVDLTLKDMKEYVYKLVTQDLGFGQQIEDALKKIQIQEEMNKAEEQHDAEHPDELIDEDFEDFYNSIQEQKEKDAEIYKEEE